MTHTKEFLISELQRFVLENGRNPKSSDMQSKLGYPAAGAYTSQFDSWNNALMEAGLEINQKHHIGVLDGTETCDNCYKFKKMNQTWLYKNNKRLCKTCYQTKNNHRNGNLNPNSSTGFAFMSQRVVAETLGLDLKYDCNCSVNFNSPYDLHDKNGYGSINVKTAVLFKNNSWNFNLSNKYTPDNYIMLGLSNDKSDIEHVWVTEPEDDLTFNEKKFQFKSSIKITNSEKGLKRVAPWEVDVEPYNDAYHSMSLENCSVLRKE